MTAHLPSGAHVRKTFVADDVVFDHQLEVFRHDFNDSAGEDPSETQETLCVTIAGARKAKAITVDRDVAIALARFVLNAFGIAHSAPDTYEVKRMKEVIEAVRQLRPLDGVEFVKEATALTVLVDQFDADLMREGTAR
jgi:hypothetical protein